MASASVNFPSFIAKATFPASVWKAACLAKQFLYDAKLPYFVFASPWSHFPNSHSESFEIVPASRVSFAEIAVPSLPFHSTWVLIAPARLIDIPSSLLSENFTSSFILNLSTFLTKLSIFCLFFCVIKTTYSIAVEICPPPPAISFILSVITWVRMLSLFISSATPLEK